VLQKGFTPLHICAKYGTTEVLRVLLTHEFSDPDVPARNGLTPLHVATHYDHMPTARVLLSHGASPRSTAQNGYTPLHIAAKRNRLDIAKVLLDECKTNSSPESKNGYTPLHLASQEGHRDMVRLLLSHGAHADSSAVNGLRPLHLAAQEDHIPIAEALVVESHGEIDPQTKAGYTPLHTACHFGRPGVIRFLLNHGANVEAKTKAGYTPLHQAAQQGHVLVINLLLQARASPNALTNAGQTPLAIAEEIGYISCSEILRPLTSETLVPPKLDEKYRGFVPETMHDSVIYDSDEETTRESLTSSSPVFGQQAPSDQRHYLSPIEPLPLTPSKESVIRNAHSEEVFMPSDDSSIPRKVSLSHYVDLCHCFAYLNCVYLNLFADSFSSCLFIKE